MNEIEKLRKEIDELRNVTKMKLMMNLNPYKSNEYGDNINNQSSSFYSKISQPFIFIGNNQIRKKSKSKSKDKSPRNIKKNLNINNNVFTTNKRNTKDIKDIRRRNKSADINNYTNQNNNNIFSSSYEKKNFMNMSSQGISRIPSKINNMNSQNNKSHINLSSFKIGVQNQDTLNNQKIISPNFSTNSNVPSSIHPSKPNLFLFSPNINFQNIVRNDNINISHYSKNSRILLEDNINQKVYDNAPIIDQYGLLSKKYSPKNIPVNAKPYEKEKALMDFEYKKLMRKLKKKEVKKINNNDNKYKEYIEDDFEKHINIQQKALCLLLAPKVVINILKDEKSLNGFFYLKPNQSCLEDSIESYSLIFQQIFHENEEDNENPINFEVNIKNIYSCEDFNNSYNQFKLVIKSDCSKFINDQYIYDKDSKNFLFSFVIETPNTQLRDKYISCFNNFKKFFSNDNNKKK